MISQTADRKAKSRSPFLSGDNALINRIARTALDHLTAKAKPKPDDPQEFAPMLPEYIQACIRVSGGSKYPSQPNRPILSNFETAGSHLKFNKGFYFTGRSARMRLPVSR
jgi:hypothetical protein